MLRIYNTLTRQIEEFVPLNGKKVGFYSCGPTVYDYAHIGNLRAYLFVDLLKRYLKYRGFEVKHVMNITDVGHLSSDADAGEDKLEKGAKRSGKTVWEVAEFYTKYFFEAMDTAGIIRADVISKATEHISQMIELIKQLEVKGFTYQTKEAVYFDVTKFPAYGKLSGQKLEDKLQAVREEVNVDPDKKHPADFSLWFKRVGRFADHAMHWESPWGPGFPGWHIECSAMAMQYLGETVDIHTGGIDNMPTHHENEIAQSEAATGKQFVKYWMHNEHLMVEGKKMSKSLGNFYTLQDLIDKEINPILVRVELLKAHYRSQANFSFTGLEEDKRTAEKFVNLLIDLDAVESENKSNLDITKIITDAREKFISAMDEDLNISLAFTGLFDFVNEVNKVVKSLNKEQAQDLKKFILEIDSVLGFIEVLYSAYQNKVKEVSADSEVEKLLNDRAMFRSEKKFAESDAIRDELLAKGIMVNDTAEGYQIRLKEVV